MDYSYSKNDVRGPSLPPIPKGRVFLSANPNAMVQEHFTFPDNKIQKAASDDDDQEFDLIDDVFLSSMLKDVELSLNQFREQYIRNNSSSSNDNESLEPKED